MEGGSSTPPAARAEMTEAMVRMEATVRGTAMLGAAERLDGMDMHLLESRAYLEDSQEAEIQDRRG